MINRHEWHVILHWYAAVVVFYPNAGYVVFKRENGKPKTLTEMRANEWVLWCGMWIFHERVTFTLAITMDSGQLYTCDCDKHVYWCTVV